MRVLLINNCHYRRGGADVVYLNTGQLLASKGHDIAYFSTISDKNEPTKYSSYFINDVDALKLNFLEQIFKMPRKLYSSEAKGKLIKLLNKFRPDIAHIHLYKGGLTASILPVLRKYKIPTAISLHDYSLICPHNILVDGDDNLCERCLNSTPFNCVIHRCNRKNIFYSGVNYIEYVINNKLFRPEAFFNKFICVCRFNLEKHRNLINIEDKLVHLYNFSPDLENIVPNHEKGDYFLFYGRLKKIKGILSLIDAWKGVSGGLKLKVAGEGNLYLEIEQKIRNEKINNVELLGHKLGDELNNLIKNASFIIVPSECYENNPMTIIEGYSFGKPIIGTKIGGIPEIIEEGKTGFTFEIRDVKKLSSLIEFAGKINSKDYNEMSINARLYAEKHFLAESHYQNLLVIYNEAINQYEK
jgi:glycosyltransferase involved in cell wall biosynthesis